jgi:CNT family concentrative nucleoside transporter
MDAFMHIGRGILGITFLTAVLYMLSNNRSAINWRLVAVGLGSQLIIALMVLKAPYVKDLFEALAGLFTKVLSSSEAGSKMVFGTWPTVTMVQEPGGADPVTGEPTNRIFVVGYIFAFKVLPTIIFFSALSAALYYLGVLQLFVRAMAYVMVRTMRLSGAESLAAAANVFMGQTEAPLVIKPYVAGMTKSELLCLMSGGMATIAGSVFAAYVQYLGGDDPVQRAHFATHLLTASIMSAPAAIVASKMLFPETEHDRISQDTGVPKESLGSNLLDAISRGTGDGLRLAANVGAMLIAFTAIVFLLNKGFHKIGEINDVNAWVAHLTGGRYNGLSFELILGLIFAPLAWLLGADNADLLAVGQLLGQKTTINEFVAYGSLEQMKATMSPKSIVIATYALCGFSNFASIGIQIGGIGALAPSRMSDLAELGIKALIAGSVACFYTAAIVGMVAQG